MDSTNYLHNLSTEPKICRNFLSFNKAVVWTRELKGSIIAKPLKLAMVLGSCSLLAIGFVEVGFS